MGIATAASENANRYQSLRSSASWCWVRTADGLTDLERLSGRAGLPGSAANGCPMQPHFVGSLGPESRR